jgi:hypothetical protein
MDKYKNIFWHQGINIYDTEEIEKNKKILNAVRHLENDVTKSFLNVIGNTDRKVIDALIEKIININNVSIKFSPIIEYGFQITDSDKEKYRNHQNKFLLKLISKLTPKLSGSAEDGDRISIPDGAIYDKSTVILIETKTQSPLYENQVKRHIKNYAPDAIEIEITWEEIYDLLHEIALTTSEKDNFLISQFCEYLDIIGLSNFHRLYKDDFESFTFIPGAENEQRLQQLYRIMSKLKKLHIDLWERWGKYNFIEKKFGQVRQNSEVLWFGYYNFNDLAKHTNLNFTINKEGLFIDVNAEISTSFKKFLNNINKNISQFDSLFEKAKFNYFVELSTKLPLGPEVSNRFYWKSAYVIPQSEVNGRSILEKISQIKDNFPEYVDKMIAEVENNSKYTLNDTAYVKRRYFGKNCKNMNPKSFCVMRVRHLIGKDTIVGMDREALLEQIIKVSDGFKEVSRFANS